MTKSNPGRTAGARACSGDDLLRLDFTIRDNLDLGAHLGAHSAPKQLHQDLRNALIAALLLTGWAHPERWTAYARDRNAYTRMRRHFGADVSHKRMLWAVESLEVAGLVEHRKIQPSSQRRFRSTLRATDKLLAMSPITHVSQLCRRTREPITLKNADGQLVSYRDCRDTRAWRTDVNQQNEALGSLVLTCELPGWMATAHGLLTHDRRLLNPSQDALYRVFNRDWNYGGRFYGAWWQGIGFSERSHIRINGEPVFEADYEYFHPTLLAAAAGIELSCDPYFVTGVDRPIAKMVFVTMLNASTERSAVLAIQNELVDRGASAPRQEAIRLAAAIKAHNPQFAGAWCTGVGLRLQCIDSHMCSDVQRTMRQAGHPVLSVHDSFVVGASKKDLLRQVMNDVLERTKEQLRDGLVKVY